jgi:hypothetical protein
MNNTRPAFIGTVLANTLVALLTTLLVDYLVSPSWLLPLAIVTGWFGAIVVAGLCCRLLLVRMLGSVYIVLSTMMTAVAVGITIAITRVTTQLALFDHLLIAAIIALLASIVFQVGRQGPVDQTPAPEDTRP